MPTRTWWSALIACVLLAGCTALNPRVERAAKKLDCDGSKDCTVVVTVNCLRYFECDMSVDYDLILVLGRNKQVDIHWKLEGEKGAEFANNGIVIENSVFECKAEGKDKYSCKDKHPDFGVFKYAINVTVKDSLFGPRGVQSLDPWVVNH
jgi:hypothetical protein